jgi:predicted RNase H-like HicB family nuclease
MFYPVAIIPRDADHAWGATVQDRPECFSAGDNLADAVRLPGAATEVHLRLPGKERVGVPPLQPLVVHLRNPQFERCIWERVEIDVKRAGCCAVGGKGLGSYTPLTGGDK